MSVVIVLRVHTRVWVLRSASDHDVRHDSFRSFCCSSESKNKIESTRQIKIDPFFLDELPALDNQGMVIVHGLVTPFLGVIALVLILLVVGLVVPHILVMALTMILVSIILMTIVRLAIIAVASMMVAIVVTAMLAVARFMATCGRKMSRFLFLWLLLVLGNFVKNTNQLVSC
jgi:hypothetical protein